VDNRVIASGAPAPATGNRVSAECMQEMKERWKHGMVFDLCCETLIMLLFRCSGKEGGSAWMGRSIPDDIYSERIQQLYDNRGNGIWLMKNML
jgi:hypothetical protein